MTQCLLVEDDDGCRMLLQATLQFYGCQVVAPTTLCGLERVFARCVQFEVVLFDGCLWNSSWLNFKADILQSLVPEGRLICVSSDPLVATVASRVFDREVEYSGKDPVALERLLLEPQLVG